MEEQLQKINVDKNILNADFTESRHEDENQIIADIKSSNEKFSVSNSKDNRGSINEARSSIQKIGTILNEDKNFRKSMIDKIFGQSQNSENSQVVDNVMNDNREVSKIIKSNLVHSVNDYVDKSNANEDEDDSTVKNIVK